MRLGQVSIEHLVLVGLALGLLVPAVYFFYAYSQQNQQTTVGIQINNIGLEMVSTVKSTYALGRNARQTLRVGFPQHVTRVYLENDQELVIQYEMGKGLTNAVFFSEINMTSVNPDGNITRPFPGVVRMHFTSTGQNVSVVEVT